MIKKLEKPFKMSESKINHNEQFIEEEIPLSLRIIIMWMIISSISLIFKQFNMSRLKLSKEIFGDTLALINYNLDFLMIVLFIIFIILFLMRVKSTWRYFLLFISFIAIGIIIGFSLGLLMPDSLRIISGGIISSSNLFLLLIISTSLQLIFCGIVAYYTYKNRRYFDED